MTWNLGVASVDIDIAEIKIGGKFQKSLLLTDRIELRQSSDHQLIPDRMDHRLLPTKSKKL